MLLAEKLFHFRSFIWKLLTELGVKVFPSVLIALAIVPFVWQYTQADETDGIPVPVKVWESPSPADQDALAQAQAQATHVPAVLFKDTRLSQHTFWFAMTAQKPAQATSWALAFPSRHAMQMSCWDLDGQLLGSADRQTMRGQMFKNRAGFALTMPATENAVSLLCSANFRGPARLSAQAWSADLLAQANDDYLKTGSMIEAGIGMLALFMLVTAVVNRSALYWTFVGWLLVNMRMAALSAGTDFEVFGMPIEQGLLTPMRQWTVTLYYATTIAMFSSLFKSDLMDIKAGWTLTLTQLSAVLAIPLCLFTSFETTLPILWVAGANCLWIIAMYMVRILRVHPSRVAIWYTLSIGISILATFNEVIAASTGIRNFLASFNSVTAAIASTLLSTAAVAEHVRSERGEKQKALETLEKAYSDSPIGLFTLQDGDLIVKSNPAFRAMFKGVHPSRLTRLSTLFAPHVLREINALRMSASRTSIDLQTQTFEGDTPGKNDHWFSINASTIDGNVVEGSLQDITETVHATARLEFLADHDPLTECLNLRGIVRKFTRAAEQPTALAYFDLDRFKLINDLYGHTAGDTVLRQVCERIKLTLGPQDLLARIGGDEFVIAFTKSSIEQAAERCHNIVATVSSPPYQIDTQSFTLSISGGLVETARFGQSPLKEIVSAADTVCRMAKKRATERLLVMESSSDFFKHHKEELELITCLEQGRAPDGLFLVMQPEISLTHPFESLNFEVLLRMRKSNGDITPAGVIIEAAEAHGKSAIIDRWVVNTVINWLEEHAGELTNTQFVGVNLSGGSLNDEAFTEELFSLFDQHKAALSMICLEITETVALTDMRNMQRFIDRAQAMGAKVGLDDFGAGYSSFGYLKGLSVDALKLDGSLVRDAATNPAGMAIITAIGGLVSNLGMKSIGEFAENLPTIQALVAAGVDYAQGYGISKPVLPERILAARSSADFIEDPAILAYVKELQAQSEMSLPLFDEPARSVLLRARH